MRPSTCGKPAVRLFEDMPHTKAIAFDLDNCIILDEKTGTGSEELKDEAWFEVFKEYDRPILSNALEISKNRIAGGKGDRADVVMDILTHFGIATSDAQKQINSRCTVFNDFVQRGMQKIKISATTRECLSSLALSIPLYVNTATPKENALQSIRLLGIEAYFKDILGRPKTKVENLQAIINTEHIASHELLFIDDQKSGWTAAQETGVRFVGITTKRNTAWNAGTPFPLIRSIAELKNVIS